jgi:hypothetical protein
VSARQIWLHCWGKAAYRKEKAAAHWTAFYIYFLLAHYITIVVFIYDVQSRIAPIEREGFLYGRRGERHNTVGFEAAGAEC